MRLLITTDTVGGVWDHTLTLAGALAGAGHAVLLAALGGPGDERLARLPAGVRVVARPFRLEWMPGAAADVAASAEWLQGLVGLWRPDLVHANQLTLAGFDLGAPVITAVHSDVLSWFREVRGEAAGPEWAWYRDAVGDGLRASRAVVAPSRHQAALTARHYGIRDVRVIHNGVDARPGPRRTGPGPLRVLCAGRLWDAGKGVALLDQAVRRLPAGVVEAHAIGAREGPGGERFAADALSVHGAVARAAVDAWMARTDVYAAPSRYEPFGLAPLEAALHGCALVLSDIPSFRELWEGCAVFFPRDDADALAAALARLAGDPAQVAALGAAARARAAGRYGAGRMAGEYLELYREVARLGAAPVRPRPALLPT